MDNKAVWKDKFILLIVCLFIVGFGIVNFIQPLIDEDEGLNSTYIAVRTSGNVLIVLSLIVLILYIFETSKKIYNFNQIQRQLIQPQQPIQKPKIKICKNCYAVLGLDLIECPHCGIKGI
jgi:hypothetical protein